MSLTFPARFMLAAAMNPCPCGFFNDKSRGCRCTQPMIPRYMQKISGPLMYRIDIHNSYQCPGGELQGDPLGKRTGGFGRDSAAGPGNPVAKVRGIHATPDLLERADGLTT